MKSINCNLKTGIMSTVVDQYSTDNDVTKIVLDYTGTEVESWDKWLDLKMADGSASVQSLGITPIAELTLTSAHTVEGVLHFQPYAKNGTQKFHFGIKAVKISKSLDVTVDTSTLKDDIIDYFNGRLTIKPITVNTVSPSTPASVSITQADDGLSIVADIPKGADGYTPVKGTDYFDGITQTKESLNIGNVDNTSDLNKPISIAQQNVINDNAISPEKFVGTDYQKVQQALDYAITNDLAIKFAKIYDITGQGSLKLNKADATSSSDRRVLYLIGVGGGIKKTDSGFIFDGGKNPVNTSVDIIKTGDIYVNGLKYIGVRGNGTKVWNGDKIIRVSSSYCHYHGIDTILSASNSYTQSMRFSNEHILENNGWAFEAKSYLDTVINNCLMENGANGISNTIDSNSIVNTGLRIENNVIENLSGIAIKLSSSFNTLISGNHMELNGSYIDLSTLNTFGQYGLTLQNNYFNESAAQITAHTPCILLNKTDASGLVGQGGCTSIGNTTNGTLYSLALSASNFLVGMGDHGEIIDPNSRYIQIGKTYDQYAGRLRTYGFVNYYTESFFGSVCPATASTTFSYTLPFNFMSRMSISITTSNAYVGVSKIAAVNGSNTVRVTFYNENAISVTVNPTININYMTL